MAGMGLELATRTWKLLRIARGFKPDVMVARVGHSVGISGIEIRFPSNTCTIFRLTHPCA